MDFKIATNLAEQVAQFIEEKIIRFEMGPGERIFETAIADDLGVSRSPVREALLILERKNLVELIPRKGASVTAITLSFIDNHFDILFSLLGLVANKCIENGLEKDFKAINDAATDAGRCAENNDPPGYYEAVIRFLLSCIKATKNALLEQLIMDLLPNIKRFLFSSFAIMAQDLKKNAQIVMKGNTYIQEKNKKMAEETIYEYLNDEKRMSLENPLFQNYFLKKTGSE
jgi:DNA-binding GntR family transcriptional regulator